MKRTTMSLLVAGLLATSAHAEEIRCYSTENLATRLIGLDFELFVVVGASDRTDTISLFINPEEGTWVSVTTNSRTGISCLEDAGDAFLIPWLDEEEGEEV